MNVVVTWIIGGTISGYCAMGNPRIATTPSSTMMIDITIATIGRLTKKRAMAYFPSGAGTAAPLPVVATGAGFGATVMPSLIR